MFPAPAWIRGLNHRKHPPASVWLLRDPGPQRILVMATAGGNPGESQRPLGRSHGKIPPWVVVTRATAFHFFPPRGAPRGIPSGHHPPGQPLLNREEGGWHLGSRCPRWDPLVWCCVCSSSLSLLCNPRMCECFLYKCMYKRSVVHASVPAAVGCD